MRGPQRRFPAVKPESAGPTNGKNCLQLLQYCVGKSFDVGRSCPGITLHLQAVYDDLGVQFTARASMASTAPQKC